MLVSIIVSNYNFGRFIADSIDSALHQTHSEVEVVVVDDGSTDESRSIIRGYRDRIVPVLIENSGQCAAVNVGFRHSRGEIIVFLDSDDVLSEDAIEKHLVSFCRPNVVRSGGYLEITDATLHPTGRVVPFALSPPGDYGEKFAELGPWTVASPFTSGIAWTRHFLDKVMPLPEGNREGWIGPDGYLTAIDPMFGRIEVVEGSLGKYRIHGRNNGPKRFQFDSAYCRNRVDGSRRRAQYAAHWARQMGYPADVGRWLRYSGWKFLLANHALHLMDNSVEATSALDMITSPFLASHMKTGKRVLLSGLLALVRSLPRDQALALSRMMLEKTWGRDAAAVAHSNRI